MEQEKTIKQFVDDFRQVFGTKPDGSLAAGFMYSATNTLTGQVVNSRNWQQPKPPRFEISGGDYIALGDMRAGKPAPSAQAVGGLMQLMKKRHTHDRAN